MKRQAKYHGEIGANGKAYRKGQFIAEQVECQNQGSSKNFKRKASRQEIEPYVWEVPPDKYSKSIYKFIAGTCYNIRTKERFYSIDYPREMVDCLVARYESGERWFYPDHEVYL